jgi:hypothetical protein
MIPGLHYVDTSCPDGCQRTAQYLLVLDALNFCFWPGEVWPSHPDTHCCSRETNARQKAELSDWPFATDSRVQPSTTHSVDCLC